MKRPFVFVAILAIASVCTQCSRIEQFVIYNESDTAIYVSYELEQGGSFPVFYEDPSVRKLKSRGEIDWSASDLPVNDEDALPAKVRIALPPHSALIFGALHNDEYKHYDQKFINDRQFNLKHLQILSPNKDLEIIPSSFDTYFSKHKGQIRLVVK
jgi:hypothetical protein